MVTVLRTPGLNSPLLQVISSDSASLEIPLLSLLCSRGRGAVLKQHQEQGGGQEADRRLGRVKEQLLDTEIII